MTVSGAIPEAIGPYRVLRPIARGGMAEVYEVEEPSTGEHFAVKLLLEAGTARKRFDREYEAMTRLNHPNIVRVYSYGFHALGPWMSMELLGGATVQAYAKRIGNPGLPERNAEVIRVAHDIARALDHIHRRGLIHRDLKSDNVLVLPDGRVKLLDFGAAHIREAMERITREGEFLGTFAYASPEQFIGRDIDHRSDLYSLGVLLYRMATGRRPFWSKDTHALAKMHVQQKPRPPRQIVPELPAELERIILALLEKKQKDRPDSGAEVAAALEALAGEPLYLPGTLDVSEAAGALVGREDQVRQVRVFLDEGQPGSVALVSGMAGSGRQTVMDMVRKEAEKRNLEVWDVWGRSGGGVLPFVETMSSVADTVPLSLPKIDATRERIQSILGRGLMTREEEREAFYRDCATLLRARVAAHGQGIALLVWNLHEMGRETMTALSLVREEVARSRTALMFVAGADDAEGALADQGLGKLAPYEEVRLPPMTVRQVAVLVGALLHRRPPPTELARRIHTASGGLPDYVNEVLAGLVKQGMLRVKGDDANRLDWASRADLRIPVSITARRGLTEELTELPAEALRILEALSMVGGDTTVDVVAWALERTEAEIAQMIDLLDERGLLAPYTDEEGDRWLRWRHELLGETVLRELNPCRRDVLRRRLLGILDEAPTFAAQVDLMLEEGQIDAAVARALEWGEVHYEANEPLTALDVLGPVLGRLEEALDTPKPEVARLLLLHARCTLAVHPGDPTIKRTLNDAARIVAEEGERADLAADLHYLRSERLRAAGEPAEATRLLGAAWKAVDRDADPAFASRIAQTAGQSRRLAADVAQATTWFQRAWSLAEASDDAQRMAMAQVGLATSALAQGQVGEAHKLASSSLTYFEEIDDANGLSLALPVWSEALRLQGRFSEALSALRRHLPVLKTGESPAYYVRASLAAAWCELDLRRLGRAQEAIEELQSTLRHGEYPDLELSAELVAGRVAVESAQWEAALQILPAVCERAAEADLGAIAEHGRALWGEALAAAGQRDEARQRFHEALTALEASGDTVTLVQARASRARALWATDDPDEIYQAYSAWVEEQGLDALRLEFVIAKARHAVATGRDATAVWVEARSCLERISGHLDDADRAVLRVHPWSRALLHEGRLA